MHPWPSLMAIIADVDNLKQINDDYGHRTSDRAIIAASVQHIYQYEKNKSGQIAGKFGRGSLKYLKNEF